MAKRNMFNMLLVLTFIVAALTQAPLEASEEIQKATVKSVSSDGLPSLFVIGDSTASNGPDLGWGSHLADYFDSSKIDVLNRAVAGRSSRTFQTEGLWDKVLEELAPGDFVLIQFGHNDGGMINDRFRARGSLRGLGEETQEIDNLQTGKHEVVHTFGWYMRKFIADTKAKGATPIILSLTVRNEWKDGRVERGSGNYSQWSAEIAESQGVAFVDLTKIIADQYELLGQVRVATFFPKDHTHTSAEAANFNAAVVVSGLKTLEDCLLTNYLSDKGNEVTAYEPDVFLKQTEEIMTETWHPSAQPVSKSDLPTLFLIGDSTVRTGRLGDGENGQWGWGAPIADFFDRTRINVENRAMGGTSSRTYQTLGLWDKVLDDMKAGDFVIMQFGHNDGGSLNDNSRARGTIKGNGEETEEFDNLLTGKHEVVHTYGWYIRKYITDAKAKGATPVVCSLIPRNRWTDEGKVIRSSDDYAKWAAEAAAAESTFFIDLNEIIAGHYEKEGQEKITALYFGPNEHTHTNAAGATLNAYCVIEGLRKLRDCSLCNYFLPIVEKIGK
jgi:lysophospholipase L1-like esterase